MDTIPTISTGQPSTLGTYRDLCKTVGFEKAKAYFEERIAKAGEDEPVLADEHQVMHLIMALEATKAPT